MDKFNLYAPQFLTFREFFSTKGHRACSGCGIAIAVRHVYKALGESAKCIEQANWQIPWCKDQIVEINDPSAGTKPSLLSIRKENKTKESFIHICFDNECSEAKIHSDALIKKLPAIAAASDYSYVATACPSHPFDLFEKVVNGLEKDGSAYIHILCPCPVGWGFDPQDTVRIGRFAVETRLFPLYEVSSGYYKLTIDQPNPRPVRDYIKRQNRFSDWNEKDITSLQEKLSVSFKKLNEYEKRGL
jgi:pyruvate ferredoxin oxidoreductase beta subunit